MREILFRAKRKDNGEWVYGVPITSGNMAVIYYPTKVCVCEQTVDINTIGQFTGLIDKNGNKVFEGDIIAYRDCLEKEHIEGVVKYGNFNCSCCSGVYGWYIEKGDIRILEDDYLNHYVAGNIIDNKELLQ